MNDMHNDPLSRRKWLGLATTAAAGTALAGAGGWDRKRFRTAKGLWSPGI